MNKFFLTLSILLVSITSFSQIDNEHLEVGEEAPIIKGIDQNGNEFNSVSVLKTDKILLVFYRGSWCPYCRKHLMSLQNHLEELNKKGVKVVVVTPELTKNSKALSNKIDANFSILHDKNNVIMNSYKVAFEVNESNVPKYYQSTLELTQKYNAEGKPVLPVPATYIIGKKGKIEYVQYDVNYTKRSDFKELLKIL